MPDQQISEARELLITGATEMREAGGDRNKELSGARKVTQAGEQLVAIGGLALAREVHATLGEHMRTVELQWYGLTDGKNIWYP